MNSSSQCITNCLAASPKKTTSHGNKYNDVEELVDLSLAKLQPLFTILVDVTAR